MKVRVHVFVLLCSLILSGSLQAQEAFHPHSNEIFCKNAVLSLDILMPDTKLPVDFDFLTGAFNLSLMFPVGENIAMVIAVPIGHASAEGESFTSLGNFTLEANLKVSEAEEINSAVVFGLSLPTGEREPGNRLGLFGDFYHSHRYVPELIQLRVGYAFQRITDKGLVYGFEAIPNVWIPASSARGDVDILLDFSAAIGYRLAKVPLTLMLESFNVAVLSSDVGFGDKFAHFLAIGLRYRGAVVCPALTLDLPIGDNSSSMINNVIGLKFDFILD